MKKILCCWLCLMLLGCGTKKIILEDLNTTANDMLSYETMETASSHFLEISLEESLRLFTEKASGILLMSRDNCPHCLQAVPILAEVAEKHDLIIYYVDCGKTLDLKALDTLEKNTENVLGKRGLLVPIVFSIINGEAVGKHIGTVATEEETLTAEQKAETIKIYEKLLSDWIK